MRQLIKYKTRVSGKSSGTTPGIWLFVSCCLILAVSCRQAEAPEYYGFQNIQIGKTEGQQTTLSTTLKFYNPNPFSVQLKRAEVDVLLNAKPAGHSVMDSTIYIPQKDTFFVPVSIQVNLQSIVSNAVLMLLNKDQKVTVTLDGKVRLKRGLVSFSRPFHYEEQEDMSALMPSGF